MIIKLNNKSKDFYNYLGKFFGSRIVDFTTKDRIYDDNDKEWYIFLDHTNVTSFLSITNNRIKNIYSTNVKHLYELLTHVLLEVQIKPSIVTNIYLDVYEKCDLKIEKKKYKNFVRIWSKSYEEKN